MPRLNDPRAFEREPPNQMMFDSQWWGRSIRHVRDQQLIDLREIVDKSITILTRQIAGRRVSVHCEASMQLHLSRILHQLGTLYEFSPDEQFLIHLENPLKLESLAPKHNAAIPRVDIVIAFGAHSYFATCAIELKFFKRKNSRTAHNRYDVYADLANLERYRADIIDETYLFVATDDPVYMNRNSSGNATRDFILSNDYKSEAGTTVTYQSERAPGLPITLEDSYTFKWDTHSIWGKGVDELYTLKIHRSAKRD